VGAQRERVNQTHLTHYMHWLAERGHRFKSYTELLGWSIDDQEGFWGSLWDYFDIRPRNLLRAS